MYKSLDPNSDSTEMKKGGVADDKEGVHQFCGVSQVSNKSGNLLSSSCKRKRQPPDLVTEIHDSHFLSPQSGSVMSKLRSSTQLRPRLPFALFYPQKVQLRQ